MTQPDLMERVDILVELHGKKWQQILSILEQEGYGETDQPINTNTLRKRYDLWLKAEKKMLPPAEEAKRFADKARPLSTQRPPQASPEPKSDRMVSAKEVLELLKDSIERRDNILAAQFQKEAYKEYDTVREQRIEERLTEKTRALLEVLVPERVNSTLQQLLEEGSPFQRDLESIVSAMVESKLSDGLSDMLAGIEIKEKSAGPGRGHKGSSVTKFSATIPVEIYEAMKELGGIFSSHLAAACELYLRARQKHPTRSRKAAEDND